MTDQQRAAFEAWWDKFDNAGLIKHSAWMAWQAALATIQPNIPEWWQLIETAPKDGYMLVHEDGAIRALFRYKGEWQKIGYPAIIYPPYGDVLVGEDAKGILPSGCALEIRDGCCENPTHWMPLPQPPKETE